jgi:hypothetical protein
LAAFQDWRLLAAKPLRVISGCRCGFERCPRSHRQRTHSPLSGAAAWCHQPRRRVQTLNKLSTTSSIHPPMLRKRRHQRLHCECIQGPPQPANIAERRFGCYDPTRMRCSMLAAGPPARALRVPDGGVCEPAMLFHGPMVSTMIFIPATALSIWR